MRPSVAGDSRVLLAVLAAALLAVTIGVTVGLPALDEHSSHEEQPVTTWNVDIRDDGDARIAITMRFRLATDNETRGFERLAAEFEDGDAEVLNAATFERAATLAGTETNRSMAVESVERSTAVQNDTGRLALSFTWTNFADTSGDRLALGDVFVTPSGTWLPRLTDRQELMIDAPPQYAPRSSDWPLRDGSVFIRGPETFDPGEPAVTFEEVSPDVSVREVTLGAERGRVAEPIDVTTNVTNTGRETGNVTLELTVDGDDSVVDSREVTVPPESSRSVTLSWTPPSPGTYAIAVNGIEAGTLTVEGLPANLSIRSVMLGSDRVRPGESASVEVDVVNEGGENGTLPLALTENGTVVETRNVTVGPGDSQSVTLPWTPGAPGTYSVGVNGIQAGSIVVEQPATTPPRTTEPPTTSPGSEDGSGIIPAVIAIVVIVALIALAYALSTREGENAGDHVGGGDGPEDPPAVADDVRADGEADATANTGVGDTPRGEGDETAGAAVQTANSEEDAADEPLLSDEEQVLALLREHGGRMKQAKIVDATDWSNAKVSQLLSDMAADDEIRKLRIGRENLIALPDEVPDGAE